MRIETTDKIRLLATLVRGFFTAYPAGIIDCHVTDYKEKHNPQTIKKIMLQHYEHIADAFFSTLFYPIAVMSHSYDEVTRIVTEAHKRQDTMMQLVRSACGTEQMYETMVSEYRRNFTHLLGGRRTPMKDHLDAFAKDTDSDNDIIDTDEAVRLTVRTVMRAYAKGIRAGGTDKSSLHQATLFHLLLDAMNALLGDTPLRFDPEEDCLNAMFFKACRTEHLFEVMTAEMDNSYTELVRDEGITSTDDTAS